MKRSGITAARLLAVIAAFCIVGAITIATVMPATLSLGQMMALADHTALAGVQSYIEAHVSDWIWLHVALPVLQRPAWLAPVAIGIIAAGLAASLGMRPGAPHSRRKRS